MKGTLPPQLLLLLLFFSAFFPFFLFAIISTDLVERLTARLLNRLLSSIHSENIFFTTSHFVDILLCCHRTDVVIWFNSFEKPTTWYINILHKLFDVLLFEMNDVDYKYVLTKSGDCFLFYIVWPASYRRFEIILPQFFSLK